MYNNNYFLLVLTFVSLLLIGCNSGSNDKDGLIPEPVAPKFIEFGLERHKVEKLLKVNDQLIALTDQGLYRYDTQWHALTDNTYHLLDMAIISDTHWIASVKQAERAFFIESGDAGASWQLFDDDFGGEDSGTDGSMNEVARTLVYDPKKEKLYATGTNVLASSSDFARSWTVEEGLWGSMGSGLGSILLHQEKQDVWYGGQNAIENPILEQFNTETYSLTMHGQAIGDHLPSPSVIYQILVDPKNSERIIASGEGGIVHTINYGDTWQPLLNEQNYRFHFSPVFDPKDHNRLFTAGWSKGADIQPLILEVSQDNGQSWQAYTYEKDGLEGGVRSLLAVEESSKTVLYIGLYKNGVVKVSFE